MPWANLPAILNDISDNWDDAVLSYGQLSTNLLNAHTQFSLGDDHQCLFWVLESLDEAKQTLDWMLSYIFPFSPKTMLMACLKKMRAEYLATGGAEVNMESILSAMVSADFSELQYFVGLVDAYRVALWNEPFNAEFYAALARGFTP